MHNFTLYENTIKTPEGEFDMTADVRASVDDKTGRKFAVGKTLTLGLLGGVTKKTGDLWLNLEGEDFYVTGKAPAGIAANQARRFASKVNAQAKVSPRRMENNGEPSRADLLESLKKLGELRDTNVLTEEEFGTQKAALLSRTDSPEPRAPAYQ